MKIEIIGKPNCPYCIDTKTLMKIKKLDYKYTEFQDLDPTEQTQVLEVKAPNARTFPIIFIDNVYVGGFTDINAILN